MLYAQSCRIKPGHENLVRLSAVKVVADRDINGGTFGRAITDCPVKFKLFLICLLCYERGVSTRMERMRWITCIVIVAYQECFLSLVDTKRILRASISHRAAVCSRQAAKFSVAVSASSSRPNYENILGSARSAYFFRACLCQLLAGLPCTRTRLANVSTFEINLAQPPKSEFLRPVLMKKCPIVSFLGNK
jgi:hypothetical protein